VPDETVIPSSIGYEQSMNSRRKIVPRTEQLPITSRVLYRIEHYSSLARVAIIFPIVLLVLVIVGAVLGFPTRWVNGFEVCTSAMTLVMVFAIQHTQGREQTAIQRKLDELLRAVPGAAESLMMLEEEPAEVMLEVEEGQRAAARAGSYEVAGDGPARH
jgi:low affinity Fe/Cu permease